MVGTTLFVSLVLTVAVLVLSLITISKGYAYKHTIDPIDEKVDDSEKKMER